MPTKTITYHPLGAPVPDASAERLARDFLLDPNQTNIVVSTSNFIDATRCLVADGVYPHDQIVFQYERQLNNDNEMIEININKYGNLSAWPKGFCDYTEMWLFRLIKIRSGKPT